MIPLVNIPEQTIAERVAELNRLVREQGISERDLVFVIEKDDLTREKPVSKLVYPPVAIRNVPLLVVLKYIQDSTVLIFKVTGGQVEFWNYHYLPRLPEVPPEPDREAPAAGLADADPFAKPE
ncbi:MAG: hypothetical protein EOP84_32300 [Verrucomicrobiaceae bacterium]|nr:MAG: hypothetical protein EOP84_32300 [Verrucomicrobiaceae bacterium]